MSFNSMFENIAERKMMEDSDYAKWVYEIKRNLNKGFYDEELVDQIMQVPGNRGFSNYDIFYFMNVYTGILKGDILVTGIYVGDTPESDKEVKENNKKLKGLPEGYSAVFANSTGSGYNDDGKFTWEHMTVFKELEMNDKGQVKLKKEHFLNPRSVSLEVGFTKAERTFEHIKAYGGVARWAYDHEYIHVFLDKKKVSLW